MGPLQILPNALAIAIVSRSPMRGTTARPAPIACKGKGRGLWSFCNETQPCPAYETSYNGVANTGDMGLPLLLIHKYVVTSDPQILNALESTVTLPKLSGFMLLEMKVQNVTMYVDEL